MTVSPNNSRVKIAFVNGINTAAYKSRSKTTCLTSDESFLLMINSGKITVNKTTHFVKDPRSRGCALRNRCATDRLRII
jgi:hypothetical protein